MTDTTSHSRQATKLHGNITSDGLHSYSYDADGNLVSVDGGSTASYYYDSMNQRVRIAPTRGTYEFVWDVFGRRVSNWSASSHALAESNAYTESSPIAVRSGGQRQYETQNWLGSERVRTTYNGGTAIAIAELPWGDGHTPSGDNGDQHDFAGMDRDLEDNTEQAQYRQYSTNLGRWQSPDPYTGSYDFGNPQSFDRYSYALNDPANLLDPSGLDSSQCAADFCVVAWTYSNCDVDPSSCGLFPGGAGLEGAGGTLALPTCHGPRTGNCINTPQVRVIRIAAGAPSKVGCSTVLPNGANLGQYINQARAQMAASSTPLLTFANIARDYGQIDFKNGAAGRSVLATNLGQAGNFAYYAIGSGFISPNMLDLGASVYAVAATAPYPGHSGKPFSTIGNGPMLIDDSAASVRNAGLATPGCP